MEPPRGNRKCDLFWTCPTSRDPEERAEREARSFCYNIASDPQHVCRPGSCVTNVEKITTSEPVLDTWLRDYDDVENQVTCQPPVETKLLMLRRTSSGRQVYGSRTRVPASKMRLTESGKTLKLEKSKVERDERKKKQLSDNKIGNAQKSATEIEKASKSATGILKAQKSATEIEKTQKSATEIKKAQQSATEIEKAQKSATEIAEAQKSATEVEKAQQSTEIEKAQKSATEIEKAPKSATEIEKAQKSAIEIEKSQKSATKIEKSQKSATEIEKAQKSATKTPSEIKKATVEKRAKVVEPKSRAKNNTERFRSLMDVLDDNGELDKHSIREFFHGELGSNVVDLLSLIVDLPGGLDSLLQACLIDDEAAAKALALLGVNNVDPEVLKVLRSLLAKGPSGLKKFMKAMGVDDNLKRNKKGATVCKCCECSPCKCAPARLKIFADMTKAEEAARKKELIDRIGFEALKNMSPEELAALGLKPHDRLTKEELKKLSPEELKAMGLDPSDFFTEKELLKRSKPAELTKEELSKLSPQELLAKGLNPADYLTKDELSNLSPKEVEALGLDPLEYLNKEGVLQLSQNELDKLGLRPIDLLTSDALARLAPDQLEALGLAADEVAAELAERKRLGLTARRGYQYSFDSLGILTDQVWARAMAATRASEARRMALDEELYESMNPEIEKLFSGWYAEMMMTPNVTEIPSQLPRPSQYLADAGSIRYDTDYQLEEYEFEQERRMTISLPSAIEIEEVSAKSSLRESPSVTKILHPPETTVDESSEQTKTLERSKLSMRGAKASKTVAPGKKYRKHPLKESLPSMELPESMVPMALYLVQELETIRDLPSLDELMSGAKTTISLPETKAQKKLGSENMSKAAAEMIEKMQEEQEAESSTRSEYSKEEEATEEKLPPIKAAARKSRVPHFSLSEPQRLRVFADVATVALPPIGARASVSSSRSSRRSSRGYSMAATQHSAFSVQYAAKLAAERVFRDTSCTCLPGICTCEAGHYLFREEVKGREWSEKIIRKALPPPDLLPEVWLSDQCICCKICEKQPLEIVPAESVRVLFKRKGSSVKTLPIEPGYERTVVIVKPDARQYKDAIYRAIKRAGLDIVNERHLVLSPEQVADVYAEQIGSPHFSLFVKRMSSSPATVLSIGGVDAIFRWCRMIGADRALPPNWFFPASMRRRFGLRGRLDEALYASADDQCAKRDHSYFFPYDILDPIIANLQIVRDYCDKYICPTLMEGLVELTRERPLDPIKQLAEFLLVKNPFQPRYPRNVALVPACD